MRIESLDGLRGVAALVVVVFHTCMTVPAWADAYRYGVPLADPLWWVTHTPVHLVWAGREAVLIFFVLSGLVLALPTLDRPLHVPAFYVRRLVRLLVPVWAALTLAAAWTLVGPPRWPGTASWWVQVEGGHLSVAGVVRDATLLVAPGDTLHPLWSLQWELVFCLALPALLQLRHLAHRYPARASTVLFAIFVGGVAASQIAAVALACFLAGALLAVQRDRLRRAADRMTAHRHGSLAWAAALVASLGLLAAHGMLQAPGGALLAPAVTRAGQGLGAVALVVLVWLSPGVGRVLSTPAAVRLGDRSFSLYLTHYPVVMLAGVAGASAPLPVLLVVALLTTLSLAAAFHRWVELPSHRLARSAGRAVTAAIPSSDSAPAARHGPQGRQRGRHDAVAPLLTAAALVALAVVLLLAPTIWPGPRPDPIADLTEEHPVRLAQLDGSSSSAPLPTPVLEEHHVPVAPGAGSGAGSVHVHR